MDQPEDLIAGIRAQLLREQKQRLLLRDAENRRLRVAAILNEWATKTMAEYGDAPTQQPAAKLNEQSRVAAEEIRPQCRCEPDRENMKAQE